MGVEALKSPVKGNSKDGKKSKHERNVYVLKTWSIILFRSNQSSDIVVIKNVTWTETPFDLGPVQKTAANQSKYKQNV